MGQTSPCCSQLNAKTGDILDPSSQLTVTHWSNLAEANFLHQGPGPGSYLIKDRLKPVNQFLGPL